MDASFRDQVASRMDELMAEYEKLEQVLQVLDGKSGRPQMVVSIDDSTPNTNDMSKADAVLWVVKTNPGVTPKDISDKLKSKGYTFAHGEQYTYLYRLKKAGRVYTKGPRGSAKYFPKA